MYDEAARVLKPDGLVQCIETNAVAYADSAEGDEPRKAEKLYNFRPEFGGEQTTGDGLACGLRASSNAADDSSVVDARLSTVKASQQAGKAWRYLIRLPS